MQKDLGLTDEQVLDKDIVVDALQDKFVPKAVAKLSELGLEPSPAKIYLMWQQGLSGASSLLQADPSTPITALTRKQQEHISSNLPADVKDQVQTVGDFVSWWEQRFQREIARG